jgi:hypothetical protein
MRLLNSFYLFLFSQLPLSLERDKVVLRITGTSSMQSREPPLSPLSRVYLILLLP